MMTANITYAEVAVALPVSGTFIYTVPDSLVPLVSKGKRVLVPFGRRRVTGYVMDLKPESDRQDLKQVLDVWDEFPLFPESMISFFKWIADYYKHPIGDVIQCALPSGLTIKDVCTLHITQAGASAGNHKDLSLMEREILDLLKNKPCRPNVINRHLRQKVPQSIIHALCQKQWIKKETSASDHSPKHRFERYVSILNADKPIGKRASTQKKVFEVLKTTGEVSLSDLRKQVPTVTNVIKSMSETGHIRIRKKRVYRDPFGDTVEPDIPPVLTEEQQIVVNHIGGKLNRGYATYLLNGVTGSGKTEVYLQLAQKAVDSGSTVLILVPEIVLISQIERRFRARFGDQIAVLHSGLSNGERYDQWIRVLKRRAPIVIGARSAVFAPLQDIGLIIVDEEHEASYKQDHGLMYQARDLAVKRASLNHCVALLGSATPSIQSFYNVKTKKYTELNLTKRVMERPLSQVQVVDLRDIKDMRGIRRFISPQLHTAMKETLDRKQQALLFLNRRGFSNISVCGTCGEAIKCKNCDISMTLHHHINAHKCHYCGFSQATATHCPICGSKHIRHLGLGTEKLEDAVRKLFPQANVARMDRDTTRRKGSIVNILKGLQNNTIDILVGTQMVAKGHDFPNITLVGIICADLSLNFPDFRSGVRTYQLLAQVSGRAGRGNIPGKVILQTYNPSHFSISAATEQNYRSFYDKDILFRKSLRYPPYSRLIQLKISGAAYETTKAHAIQIGHIINNIKERSAFGGAITILGPIESAVSKIAKQYRWQILLKGGAVNPLHMFADKLITEHTALFNHRKVTVKMDVDPYFMM